MTPEKIAKIAEYARQQNERAAATGHCTRYVENIDVLIRVAAIMTEHEAQEGADHARPA